MIMLCITRPKMLSDMWNNLNRLKLWFILNRLAFINFVVKSMIEISQNVQVQNFFFFNYTSDKFKT